MRLHPQLAAKLLGPCPNCLDAEHHEMNRVGDGGHEIRCRRCGYTSGTCGDPALARLDWNARCRRCGVKAQIDETTVSCKFTHGQATGDDLQQAALIFSRRWSTFERDLFVPVEDPLLVTWS